MMIRRILLGLIFFAASALTAMANDGSNPAPISTQPWREVVVSAHDLDEAARFFRKIAGFETLWQGTESPSYLSLMGLDEQATATSLVLGAPGVKTGRVRLIKFANAGPQQAMRPGARAWDSGCFFSIMMRAKGLDEIYDDALRMGWWTETPIADVTFGASTLKIVIFRGPQGMQVQAYERLSPALPEAFPAFDRLSVPFNIMQIVRDRDVSKDFFVGLLGFDTVYLGKPYTSPKVAPTPLGIPLNLTISARYRAGIYSPKPGEVGRVETIEMIDLKGFDHAARCAAPNYGILSVKFPVPDAASTAAMVRTRGSTQPIAVRTVTVEPYGTLEMFSLMSPDGAIFEFFSER